jgi:adenine-specific DNA-methyltransferase
VKASPTADKLRGGYYTPRTIADFLVDWAIPSPDLRVLEPSAGDGVFLRSAAKRMVELGGRDTPIAITAVEVDRTAAQEARWALAPVGAADSVHEGDFFAFAEAYEGVPFDAVIGNPPFLRFQHFQEQHREPAFRLMRSAGLHPSRLTNAWLPFVAVASRLLSDRGRLAMVVPAELLQVGYASELREFLSNEFARITIVAFSSLVFEDIQQEVVLLLADKAVGSSPGIRVLELPDAEGLQRLDPDHDAPVKPMDHSSEKWTRYFLDLEELDALRAVAASPKLTRLGQLASVDIGVVTGNNDFFLLRHRDEFNTAGIGNFLVPILTRSRQLRGLEFNTEDWEYSEAHGDARYLLSVLDGDSVPEALEAYLQTGLDADVHLGYKCRIRKNWYVVPSTHAADAFLLRQVHSYPILSWNRVGGASTDTVHRVRYRSDADPSTLSACFHNSITFAFAEVLGRSYGGGVLELEPSEADALPLPYAHDLAALYGDVDRLLRAGDIESVLDTVDREAARALDLDPACFSLLRRGWKRLRDRRIGRR